jgi:hypothetical protein
MRRCLLVAVLLAGACSSHATVTTAPTPTVAPTTARPVVPRPAFAVTVLSAPLTFASADGNLTCDIESAYARCDPRSRAWATPAAPSDCFSGWGKGIELQAGTKASFFCASEALGSPHRVLAAKHAFKVGFIQCDGISATTIHCHGTADPHGFTISKAKYSVT